MGVCVKPAVWLQDCPHCGVANYYDEDSPADESGPYLEGLTCWRCRSDFILDECVDFCEDVEDAFCDEGREAP